MQPFSGSYFSLTATLFWALAYLVFLSVIWIIFRAHLLKTGNLTGSVSKLLWFLIVLGILARLADVAIVAPHGPELIDGFYQRAVWLCQGKGWIDYNGGATALWMPGSSWLYAAAILIFGTAHDIPLYVTQAFLGFSLMLTTFALGRLRFGKTTGLLAAAFMGLFPSQVILGTFGMSDLAFVAFLWGGIAAYAWMEHLQSRPLKRIGLMLSPLLLGLAVMTRPYGLPVVLLYFAWRLCGVATARREIFAPELRKALFVFAAIGVFWGGWIIRNYRVFHHFVPFTTTSGINLWVANHPGASGKLEYLPPPHPYLSYLSNPAEEWELDRKMRAVAAAYIRSHPFVFIKQIPKKWAMLFASDTAFVGYVLSNEFHLRNSRLINFIGGVANGYYLSLLVMSAWFCWSARRRLFSDPDAGFGMLVFFGLLAIFAVYHIETRFHMPVIPALCIYGAAFLRDSAASRNDPATSSYMRR